MPGKEDWEGKVGESWASEWRRTDLSFSNLTPRLVERILSHPFARALDIGCGAGELSFRVAKERPSAEIHGIDVSESLLEVARERLDIEDNVRFELADASNWSAPDGDEPQALFSRHGVMFFTDPVGAFASLRSTASDHARLTFSCFRELADNPFYTEIGNLLPKQEEHPNPYAPGPFAFADGDRVATILRDAGWKDIELERVDFDMIAGEGEHAVDEATAYFNRIGPVARAASLLEESERASIREKIGEFAQANHKDGTVALTASVWIVTAGK